MCFHNKNPLILSIFKGKFIDNNIRKKIEKKRRKIKGKPEVIMCMCYEMQCVAINAENKNE